MLFNKNQINRYKVIIIILFFFGAINSSCSRKKVKPQKTILASYEFPTKRIPLNCKKTFESLTLLLKRVDLKRISFKNNFIKTHWIDNTFSFFSKEENSILEKSAKFKLYLKGKKTKKNEDTCKLAIFKNQKVKYSSSGPWISAPSDLSLEKELFSKLTEGNGNEGDYLPNEELSDENVEGEEEEDSSDSIVEEEGSLNETIEDPEDSESIEDIESIERVEAPKEGKDEVEEEGDEEESIESIESLES